MIEEQKKQDGEMSPRKYNIRESVDEQLKLAMRERRHADLMAYRNIKSEITAKEKENGKPADDSVIIPLFKTMIKTRAKAAETFKSAGRDDLAAENQLEIDIMAAHVPKQMDANELKYILEGIAKEHSMYSKSSMGSIMRIFSERHPDEDKGTAAKLLQQILV